MDLGRRAGVTMAGALDITQDWADGTYTFRLPIAQLEEHGEACSAGPLAVLRRLLDGSWRLPDVRETIRLGLIGGGVKPPEALKLLRRYVDARPLPESVALAALVLAVAMRGGTAEGARPGKQAATESVTDPMRAGSTSPPSDATPSSSASAPAS